MIGGKTMVVTYQAEDFFSNDSHNLVLYAKDDKLRNELIQLFMVASLNKSLKPIYSWGDSVSKTKIVKDKFQPLSQMQVSLTISLWKHIFVQLRS